MIDGQHTEVVVMQYDNATMIIATQLMKVGSIVRLNDDCSGRWCDGLGSCITLCRSVAAIKIPIGHASRGQSVSEACFVIKQQASITD